MPGSPIEIAGRIESEAKLERAAGALMTAVIDRANVSLLATREIATPALGYRYFDPALALADPRTPRTDLFRKEDAVSLNCAAATLAMGLSGLGFLIVGLAWNWSLSWLFWLGLPILATGLGVTMTVIRRSNERLREIRANLILGGLAICAIAYGAVSAMRPRNALRRAGIPLIAQEPVPQANTYIETTPSDDETLPAWMTDNRKETWKNAGSPAQRASSARNSAKRE